MSSRKIATSTLWQLSSQITMAALSILTVKFVAIGLSKELAGNYNSAYGFLQMFGILADFGLYAVSVREVARAKTHESRAEILGALIVLRIIIMMIALGSALVLVWILPVWKGTPLPLSVTIAALVPFFTLLAGIVRTIFQVEYKMHYVFIAEVAQRIVAVSLVGAFIVMGVRGSTDLQHLHMFLFFGGVGAFVLFAISLFYANRLMVVRPNFDPTIIKRLAFAAAPFGAAYFCTALYREFDITLIALLRPDFQLQNAYYGFVVRIMGMGFLLPTFLLNSTLPMLEKGKGNAELLGKTLLVILLLGTVSLLFAALWARPIMLLLTTPGYMATLARPGADTALLLMAIPLFCTGLITYGFYVLLHLHAWRRLVVTLLAGAVLSVSINLLLIPQHGFVGAAVTSNLVHVILVLLLLPQALSALPVAFPLRYIQRWGAFTLLLAAFLWLMLPLLTTELMTLVGLVAATIWMGVAVLLTRVHKI